MNEDNKTKSEELPRSRERRPNAPSLLFKRAFSDIGVSARGRRSLDSQVTSPSEAERTSRFQRRESEDSDLSIETNTPERESEEEKSSWRSESASHPSWLGRTITRTVPKEELEVRKEKSKVSQPSPRTDTPKKEIVEEKSTWRSERADHASRIKRTRSVTPKEEPEVRKERPEVRKERAESCKERPEVFKERPEVRKERPEVRKERPESCKERPEVRKERPEVRKERPEVRKERPEVRKERPEACIETPEVRKGRTEASVDTPRLVFLYESDKESDTGDNPEKDLSIGSDFSDIEDMGTLARFSQEDEPLPGCPMEDRTAGTSTPGYVVYPRHLYNNSWSHYKDLWPTSPLYKPNAEQNKWRQDTLDKSCVSEVSFNAELSHNTSSDSDGEIQPRRDRSRSFDTMWTSDDKRKAARRTLEIFPTDDSSTPKFLRDGFIDTHCHLDMLFARLQHKRSFADLRRQYASTFPSEFQGCITDYCDPRTLERLPWRHVLNENLVWGAFGCHPHFAQYYTDQLQEEMMQAMRHPKAIAYGEMGLDYSHKCSTTVPDQHAVFEKQLKLAVPLGKPLVIHCRDADEDLFRIMKKWVPHDYKIHRHCFTGSYRDIEPFLNEFPNMSVGFTAVLTYPSAASARDAVSQIPLDKLIIETDAPFFVPRQVIQDR
ncbi:unnamed protein product [Staurois parvus]|uniref:Uncharacterized protein n=1 Tax=Staurois parvus TaxID=386267 RepID=A0ABN9HQ20_9NEOB|nr:unnamed protein product [Staurois parvus]